MKYASHTDYHTYDIRLDYHSDDTIRSTAAIGRAVTLGIAYSMGIDDTYSSLNTKRYQVILF